MSEDVRTLHIDICSCLEDTDKHLQHPSPASLCLRMDQTQVRIVALPRGKLLTHMTEVVMLFSMASLKTTTSQLFLMSYRLSLVAVLLSETCSDWANTWSDPSRHKSNRQAMPQMGMAHCQPFSPPAHLIHPTPDLFSSSSSVLGTGESSSLEKSSC